MKPLLSASQLTAIQQVGQSGMQVDVVFKRPVFGSDELGDDAPDQDPQIVAQVKAYVREVGGDVAGGVDVARITTTRTFEIGVPIGTDVQARDIAIVNGREFRVSQVDDDDTWPNMLNCSVRRAE